MTDEEIAVLAEALNAARQDAHSAANAALSSDAGVPPDVLYHFTNGPGLKGILDSGNLWATHFGHLNDPAEVRHLDHVVREVAQRELARPRPPGVDSPEDRVWGIGQVLFRAWSGRTGTLAQTYSPYVTSLCSEVGSIAQWDRYAGSGAGFAIGFRSSVLRQACDHVWSSATLRPVLYSAARQLELVSGIFNAFLKAQGDHARARPVDLAGEGLIDGVRAVQVFDGTLARVLATFAPCLKSAAWRDEREWRLVVDQVDVGKLLAAYYEDGSVHHMGTRDDLSASLSAIQLRTGGTGLVPYLNIEFGAEGFRKAIAEIVIGPRLDPQLAEPAVRLLLHKSGLADTVEIKHQEIPFRPSGPR